MPKRFQNSLDLVLINVLDGQFTNFGKHVQLQRRQLTTDFAVIFQLGLSCLKTTLNRFGYR